eukprot:CAMPEP_0194273704 /NCGR_PEP_ID=MMETSP0169-20130528/6988_1 /TAXON_ID=218684 /ORGANISM="Corethron pennatum, Strain L29A3" /LENGTH=173 /DNA_ID=CAMNT_0039016735 /DNA_START=154 /DNA_END=671 /DNA_ORIENTATION=+
MDGVHTHCRSRGADGLAFVIRGIGGRDIGGFGHDLGYGGIENSLAVEFDTYYNYEDMEPYENHVSIHTRGGNERNSPAQNCSLGYTNSIQDLTNGIISVRIRYIPIFDMNVLNASSFQASSHVTSFLQNGGWKSGIGLLHVYVQNLFDAVLVVPLNLDSTINLHAGRAAVGFT